MSGTELDITVDGALTEEVISGERAALFASGKREANLVEHYIMYPSTKDSKERQNITDNAKVLSLAMKPYSTSLSAFRSRLFCMIHIMKWNSVGPGCSIVHEDQKPFASSS